MSKYPIQIGPVMSRVWEVGHGDRPVVLVHDLSLRADWWRHNLKALGAGGLRGISFDLPGHGFADKLQRDDHSLTGYGDFVVRLCGSLGLERPILVGAGFGANIALRAAAAGGLDVGGLVLCSPMGVVPATADADRAMANVLFDLTRQGAARRIDALVADRSALNDDWCEEEYRVCASPGSAEVNARLKALVAARNGMGLDADLLRRIDAPALVVWGDRDGLASLASAVQAGSALGGQVGHATLQGAGHAGYFDSAATFNLAVVEFARAVPR